jgi:hypothetical protein
LNAPDLRVDMSIVEGEHSVLVFLRGMLRPSVLSVQVQPHLNSAAVRSPVMLALRTVIFIARICMEHGHVRSQADTSKANISRQIMRIVIAARDFMIFREMTACDVVFTGGLVVVVVTAQLYRQVAGHI